MAVKYKKGDVVQLISGGPPMTVEAVKSKNSVRCKWFVIDKAVSEDFDAAIIRMHAPAPDSNKNILLEALKNLKNRRLAAATRSEKEGS